MENKLAVVESRTEITAQDWNLITTMAPVMHASRLFGVTSVEQAAAIMLKGKEVGFGFAASFDLIQVIQGKPAVSPRGALALIMQNPEITELKLNRLVDGKGAFVGYECTMSRGTKITYTSRFTMEDAKRAGLIKQDSGWEKYPENMCLWRVVGFTSDVVAPDITSGLTGLMKMPEAYGVALSETGDVIDLQTPTMAALPSTEPPVTLDALERKYGAEAVFFAAGNTIPSNQEQLDAVAKKLEVVP